MTPRRDDAPDLDRRRLLGGMAVLPLLPLALRFGGDDEPVDEVEQDDDWNEPLQGTGAAGYSWDWTLNVGRRPD